jgi:hypothetical protein
VLPLAGRSAFAQPARSSAVIRTLEWEATARWYEDKLNFRRLGERDTVQGHSVLLDRGGFLLEVTEYEREAIAPLSGVLIFTLNVADVDEEIERLRALDVEIVRDPFDELSGRRRAAAIADNEQRIVRLRESLGSPASFNPSAR